MHLLKPGRVSFEEFKIIKFDRQFPERISYVKVNSDTLFLLDPKEHPSISDVITTLKTWDKNTGTDSKGAALFGIIYYYINGKLNNRQEEYRNLTREKSIEALTHTKNYLQTHFGKIDVTLGEYQKLVRGNKAIPLPGLPDVSRPFSF